MSGEVEEAQTLFSRLPEDFTGRTSILVDFAGKLYEAELLIQSSFIIAAKITDRSTNQKMFGDFAMKEIQEKLRDGRGKVEVYRLREDEFKKILGENEDALLELIVDLKNLAGETKQAPQTTDKTQTPKPPASMPEEEGNPDNLETDWQIFNEEWKKYDEKQKPFLEALLKQKFKTEKEPDNEAQNLEQIKPVVPQIEDVEKKLTEYDVRLQEKTGDYSTNKARGDEVAQPAEKKYRVEEISDEMILGGGAEEIKKPAASKTSETPNIENKISTPPSTSSSYQTTPNKETVSSAESKQPQTTDSTSKPTSTEELLDKTTKEIESLKQRVEIFWGYDKKKKRFVGMDYKTAKENGCLPPEYEQQMGQQTLAQPVSQVAASPVAAEAVKAEVTESRSQQVTECVIPILKKKPGLVDRMKLMKTPSILKVLDKIDGRKTIEQIKKETKLPPEEVDRALDALRKEGYI